MKEKAKVGHFYIDMHDRSYEVLKVKGDVVITLEPDGELNAMHDEYGMCDDDQYTLVKEVKMPVDPPDLTDIYIYKDDVDGLVYSEHKDVVGHTLIGIIKSDSLAYQNFKIVDA